MKNNNRLTKEEFFKRVSTSSISEDQALNKLAEELHFYESKYKMRSEVFMNVIAGTPAEDTPDFLAWKSCYQSYFRLYRSKFAIEEITANAV